MIGQWCRTFKEVGRLDARLSSRCLMFLRRLSPQINEKLKGYHKSVKKLSKFVTNSMKFLKPLKDYRLFLKNLAKICRQVRGLHCLGLDGLRLTMKENFSIVYAKTQRIRSEKCPSLCMIEPYNFRILLQTEAVVQSVHSYIVA